METRGELAEGVLPAVLRSLYVGRRTGLLHVRRGEERGSVCFIQGNIVYGETTIKECHLGETLVRHGLLTQWELDRAAEVVAVTGKRLGEVLVDLGNLSAEGLEDALALHVREVLLTIFSWRDGSYDFDEHDKRIFKGYDHPLKLSTGEVILDAVWSITDPDVIRFALGDLDRVLTPATDPLLRFQRIALSPTDGFILSRVDGSMTAREILAMVAPESSDEAQRSLFGLLYTGMVEFLPDAPPARPSASGALRQRILEAHQRLPSQSHFETLGVTPSSTPNEVLAAYFRAAKLYHPDSHHEPGLADLKDKLEALFARVTEAHRVLSNPESRAAYHRALGLAPFTLPAPRVTPVPAPATKPPAPAAPPPAHAPKTPPAPPPAAEAALLNAAETLDRADQSLGAGRYWETLALVDEVLPGAKGRERRRARVLKAQALLKGEGGRRAAEDELKQALEEDRGNHEAHYVLGTIYRAGGANALATASFRRALDLKPRHAGALAALASMEGGGAPSAKPTGGFRKKLFGGGS